LFAGRIFSRAFDANGGSTLSIELAADTGALAVT